MNINKGRNFNLIPTHYTKKQKNTNKSEKSNGKKHFCFNKWTKEFTKAAKMFCIEYSSVYFTNDWTMKLEGF